MDLQVLSEPAGAHRAELAKVALTFLHRCDMKGIEARRMVEVQQWLEGMIAEPQEPTNGG